MERGAKRKRPKVRPGMKGKAKTKLADLTGVFQASNSLVSCIVPPYM
jgi:hypothetical protein